MSGRVDHQFVFERDEALGDARIRLQLVVSGDELTKVLPFVHVPEAFERRFEEMRSANNAIAGIASITAGLLYGLVGCILGALWLLRQHWLVWKPPLVAGMVVGLLLAATILANSPSAWFGFSTAQDEGTFWVRQIALALLVFVGGGLALGEVFMAAEGLTRRAFPHHPQLWRLWSREASGHGRGRRTHRRRLSLRSRSTGADRRVLFRDEPVAGLVAAVGGADRSQHSVVRGAGADADLDRAAGRLHGGVRVPRGTAGARCTDR